MPNQYTLLPMPERFWTKVDRSGPIPQGHPEYGPCWLWTGSLDTAGYGSFRLDRRTQKATRIAWGLGGLPAESGHVLHTCDIRRCVRNDSIGTYELRGVVYERHGHLWLGNNTANTHDKEAKGRGSQPGHPGVLNPSAKLTEVQIVEIRTIYATGTYRRAQLAHHYGVHISLIDQIVWGVIWKHAGGPIREHRIKV